MPLEPRNNSARFGPSHIELSPGPGTYNPKILPKSTSVIIGRWRGLGRGWQYAPDLSLPGPGAYSLSPTFISTKPVPEVPKNFHHARGGAVVDSLDVKEHRKLHASLFVENPLMSTTAEFQERVAAFYDATEDDRARAKVARYPSFSEVKLKAEKEVLQLRER